MSASELEQLIVGAGGVPWREPDADEATGSQPGYGSTLTAR